MDKDKLFQSVSHISLMTTDACNLRCSYCFIECTPANSSKMPLETAKISARRLIQQSKHPTIFLHIYGGEPLTMEDTWIEEFVQYSRTLAREHSKQVNFPLSTNGTLLNEERLLRLHSLGISFSLSCDGPPDIHDVCRQGGEAVHRLLQFARKQNIQIGIVATINQGNCNKMWEVMEYFREQGVPGLVSNFVKAQGRGDSQQISSEEMYKSRVTMIEHMLKTNLSVHDTSLTRLASHFVYVASQRNDSQPHWYPYCNAGKDMVGVDSEGDIFVCGGTRDREYRLGRIGEVVDEERLLFIRDHFPKKGRWFVRCFDCKANHFCLHGCPISNDLSEAYRDNYCQFTRMMWTYFCENPDTAVRLHQMSQERFSKLNNSATWQNAVNPV